MNAVPLPLETRQFALDLRALLDDLDPARWRPDRANALVERLETLAARLSDLRAAYDTEERLEALRAKLRELEDTLRHHAPSQDSLQDAWMGFRARVEPAYETLTVLLQQQDVRVPNLRPTNYTRNIFHVGAALTALLLVELGPPVFGSFYVITALATGFALLGWSMELGRRVSPMINDALMRLFGPVAHPHEAHHVNSSTWYTSALALLSMTGAPVVCAVALAILGVADPMAAVIGKRFGRVRFSNGRSLEGSLAFVFFGGGAALGALALFHPTIPWGTALLLTGGAATAGALTEQLVSRVDDNLSIPVAAGLTAWALGAWLNVL